MARLEILLIALACASLAGCGTTTRQTTARMELMSTTDAQTLAPARSANKSSAQLTPEERAALANELKRLETDCMPRLTGMEQASKEKATNAFWLSVAGVISGAVVGPALTAANASANAAWIAATSGFGGATNFMSQSLASSGLSGTSDATTRNTIVTAIWAALGDAFNESKGAGERLTAIDRARAACVFYSIAVPSIPNRNSQ